MNIYLVHRNDQKEPVLMLDWRRITNVTVHSSLAVSGATRVNLSLIKPKESLIDYSILDIYCSRLGISGKLEYKLRIAGVDIENTEVVDAVYDDTRGSFTVLVDLLDQVGTVKEPEPVTCPYTLADLSEKLKRLEGI